MTLTLSRTAPTTSVASYLHSNSASRSEDVADLVLSKSELFDKRGPGYFTISMPRMPD